MSLVSTTSPLGLSILRLLKMPAPFSSWSPVPINWIVVALNQVVSVLVARPPTRRVPGPFSVRISATVSEPFTVRLVASAMSALKPGTRTRSSTEPVKFKV